MAIWIATRPGTEDRWSDVPDLIQDNWETYGEATSAEHGPLGSSTSGTHSLCGAAGVCYYGTTTSINAISSPPSGALAYDQTLGWLKRYWAGTWAMTTSSEWDRARYYLANNISMASVNGNTQTVGISFDARTYDTFSGYASGSSKYVASADGNYLIVCQATVNGSGVQGTSSAASATNDIDTEFAHALKVYTSYPTSDILTGWTVEGADTHYEAIDESVINISDYVSTNTASALDAYGVGDTFILSDTESATVSLSAYSDASLTTRTLYFTLCINQNWHSSSGVSIGTQNAWRYYTWSTNPETSAAWVTADIEGTGSNPVSAVGLCGGGGSMRVYNLKYVAKGILTGDHYIAIDEYPTSEDGTYLSANCDTTTIPSETYSASGGWDLPALATNISASVYIRAKRAAGSVVSAGSILRMSDGVAYSGHNNSIPFCALDTAGFTTYEFKWPNNPVTDAAWTIAQIEGTASNQSLTGFGFYASGGSTTTEMDVSQAYLVVDFQLPDPSSTLEVWKNYNAAGSALLAKSLTYSPQVGTTRNDASRAVIISQLACADYVTFHMTKTLLDDTIISGSDATYFCIHRLGNSCL